MGFIQLHMHTKFLLQLQLDGASPEVDEVVSFLDYVGEEGLPLGSTEGEGEDTVVEEEDRWFRETNFSCAYIVTIGIHRFL